MPTDKEMEVLNKLEAACHQVLEIQASHTLMAETVKEHIRTQYYRMWVEIKYGVNSPEHKDALKREKKTAKAVEQLPEFAKYTEAFKFILGMEKEGTVKIFVQEIEDAGIDITVLKAELGM